MKGAACLERLGTAIDHHCSDRSNGLTCGDVDVHCQPPGRIVGQHYINGRNRFLFQINGRVIPVGNDLADRASGRV